jgi:predicted permease
MPDWRKYVQDHLPALHVSPEREAEIVGELALQLEQAYSEALRAGLTDPEAQERAHLQVRDWDRLASEINDAERPAPKPEALTTGVLHDLRHAFRFLRRNPLLATIAIATLAFGIGANTAIFTIVDAIALRGLPYDQPDRLMAIETRRNNQPELEPWSSALDFWDVRERTRSFTKLAGISPIWNVVMTGRGEAQRLEALYVSAEFFPMLGVRPARGRLFVQEDDNKTHPANVVILSHAFWQKEFGGSPDALGKSVAMDGGSYTVIGVLPPDFRYLGEPLAGTASDIDVWFPLAANQLIGSPRGLRFLKLIGRLKPGITAAQANDEIGRAGLALAKEFPASDEGFAWSVSPLNDQITGRSRTTLFLLLGAVGFVLLMACANVAHLLLARAAARQRDLAVRVALGASRYRLLRHLLSEGAALAVIGAGAGILLALALLKFLIAAGPAALLQTRVIKLDLHALLFTASAAILSAILSGLPPAWRVVRSEIGTALRQGGRSLTAGHHRLRAALVVAQVGLALVLLVGAGLLIHSFVRLLDVNPGFESRQLLTLSTQMPNSAQKPEQRAAIYRSIRGELLTLPGVRDVAAVSRLPLLGSNLGSWLFREAPLRKGEQPPDIEYRGATANYFSTMGIPLRKGRLYDDHDGANPVAVIDEVAAAKFWPGQDPVGQRIKLGPNADKQTWITITGVVGGVRHSGLAIDPQPHVYRPYAQNPLYSPILVIRTAGDPSPMINTITSKVRSVNQEIPVYNVYPMQALVERSTAQRRFVMLLLTGFAGAALLLALVGIYGTVAQSVVQRSQEIGLRMALGATPSAALRLVLSEGSRLIAAGIGAGALASLALTRLMRSMLFEVHPLDPVVLIGAALTLAAFALLACYGPARRATRVDPIVALRVE